MTERGRLSPRQLAEPALESCRDALRRRGHCSNLTSYMRAGAPLLTALWRFPHPDRGKAEIPRLFGRLGLALGADLAVMVDDTWMVTLDTSGWEPGEHEIERPSAHPDRFEALVVVAATSAGVGWSWRQRYDRAGEDVAFRDVEEMPGLVGPTADALVAGLRAKPNRPTPRATVVLGHLAGWLGEFPVAPLCPEVAELLERETR